MNLNIMIKIYILYYNIKKLDNFSFFQSIDLKDKKKSEKL